MTKRILTPDEAKLAIYIDFEGRGKTPKAGEISPEPDLLGLLVCKTYEYWILTPCLQLLTRPRSEMPWQRRGDLDLDGAVEALLDRAESEGRLICFFSNHEAEIIANYCKPEIKARFEHTAVNAKQTIGRWASKSKRPPEQATLEQYCRIAKLPTYEPPGKGVGKTIRTLSGAFRKTKKWRDLSAETQKLAKELVKYNRQDCVSLRKLTIKAANYVAPTA